MARRRTNAHFGAQGAGPLKSLRTIAAHTATIARTPLTGQLQPDLGNANGPRPPIQQRDLAVQVESVEVRPRPSPTTTMSPETPLPRVPRAPANDEPSIGAAPSTATEAPRKRQACTGTYSKRTSARPMERISAATSSVT